MTNNRYCVGAHSVKKRVRIHMNGCHHAKKKTQNDRHQWNDFNTYEEAETYAKKLTTSGKYNTADESLNCKDCKPQ